MYTGSWNAVSNKADFIDCIEIIDQETDEPIDLSTLQDIIVQLIYPQSNEANPIYAGYSSGWNYNGISATLKGGEVAHVQTGIFQFHFTAGRMRGLPPQNYHLGVGLVAEDGTIVQLIIGTVPVMEGFIIGAAA